MTTASQGQRTDGFLQFFDLVFRITHGRQNIPDMRILLVNLPATNPRHRVSGQPTRHPIFLTPPRPPPKACLHGLSSAHPQSPVPSSALTHSGWSSSMTEGASTTFAPGFADGMLSLILFKEPSSPSFTLVMIEQVGPPQVDLARIIQFLMAGSQCVQEDNLPVRRDERKIVVSTVPDDHLGFPLRSPKHLFVIHARVNRNPLLHQRFEFFPLFDGACLFVHVPHARKSDGKA